MTVASPPFVANFVASFVDSVIPKSLFRQSSRRRVAAPLILLVSCICLALIVSCRPVESSGQKMPAPPLPVEAFSGERALEEVRQVVALGPRVSGAGAERAARHIAARLKELGLEPGIDEFQADSPDGKLTFRNVEATVGLTNKPLVVLLSHYDTPASLPAEFVGANDSGSSTGILLEIARLLCAHPPENIEVLLAFLDGEEARARYSETDGLQGSRRLARALAARRRAPHAVILLDMVGDRDLTVTIPRNSSAALTSLALECARAEGVREKFGLCPGEILDDHVPFIAHGYAALDLIDFEYGTAPGRNDLWHTPADTVDKLSAESLQTMGRVVVRMLNSLPLDPPPR